MRTYGELYYSDLAEGRRAMWIINAEPHVMMRVKRMFGRVRVQDRGAVVLADTIEVARDLEWLLDRHPLKLNEAAAKRLKEGADAYRQREEMVEEILQGRRRHLHLVEPARPAREYQQVAADLAMTTGRLLVTDEVGLGKSMTGAMLFGRPDALPALVVTLTHLPNQWKEEIAKTWPLLDVHIVTSRKVYDPPGEPDVLIMNYHKLSAWVDHLAGVVQTVVFDEAQELRRSTSLKYEAAAQIADRARYKVGLTATPIYNYGGEIHNVISVLDPDALGTREEFLREWGSGSFNDHITVAQPEALGAYLRDQGLMIGRTRKEVGRELPDEIRITQEVDADEDELQRLTGNAIEMAKLILARSTESKERWKASGELDWRLRQATGIAKAPFVTEFVRLLLESEEKVVLYGWHRAVYDIWRERLKEFFPVFYTGEESPEQKLRAEQQFKLGRSRLMIMSLRAGAGLDGLQEVSHVAVFGELDWSPQVHGQCIGRLRRDGQDEPVVAYFLVSDHGSDPVIAEVLNLKRSQSEPMINPTGELFTENAGNTERVRRLAEEVMRRGGINPEEFLEAEAAEDDEGAA